MDPARPRPARERRALKIWVALHGIVMLANHGLLRGQAVGTDLEALVQDVLA